MNTEEVICSHLIPMTRNSNRKWRREQEEMETTEIEYSKALNAPARSS